MNKFMEEVRVRMNEAQEAGEYVTVSIDCKGSMRVAANIIIEDVDYSDKGFMITSGELIITIEDYTGIEKHEDGTYVFKKENAEFWLSI